MQALLDQLQARFGDAIVETSSYRGDDCAVVAVNRLVDVARFLKIDGQMNFLMDVCGVDYPDRKDRLEIVYHFYSLATNKRLCLKVRVPEANPTVPSLFPLWKSANWFERETFDMFGVIFEGHPCLKRLLTYEGFVGHPLRKDYPVNRRQGIPTPVSLLDDAVAAMDEGALSLHTHKMHLNMGPSHPTMHGTLRVMLTLDGETIVDGTPEIGYLHRCFEKESEDHTYTQIFPYTDRLNYLSALMNNVGYAMAVEKLLGITVPERAQYIRVLICELSRIMDHLICIGTNLVDLGALTNFWYLVNPREHIVNWVERLTGARLTNTYVRVGGCSRDLPEGSGAELKVCLKELNKATRDVLGLLKKNRIFLDRTQGVGAISAEDAISWGFTGPCLRACGVDYDIRKKAPYYQYADLDWDVPVGTMGDCYDRLMVRFEEILQSTHIVEQVLDRMKPGPVQVDDRHVILPPKSQVYNSIEGLINHFELIMFGIRVPKGEAYSYTEAANGELGFYIVSDGSGRPYRIKVRPPCFAIYQAYPELIKGGMIADAVAILGTLNIIAGELDR